MRDHTTAPGSRGPDARESTFAAHDGVELFYRYWPAREPRRGVVLLLHRGHEHSGRMAHLVDELDLPAFDFVAWDARGHGRSPGARGDAPGFDCLVRDLQSLVDHLRTVRGAADSDVAVVAQSVAAVVAATWAHDYAPGIRALVLASPAFDVRLYVPFARPGLALLKGLRGNFFVTSYVKPRLLTRDSQRQASYDSDPLIARAISVDVLLGLHSTAQRIVADAAAIVVPTQLLVSGADWVVRRAPQQRFFDRLGAPVKEWHLFADLLHDTLGERDRAAAVAHARRFLLSAFAAPATVPDLRDADRAGTTRDEYDALRQPLGWWTPRGAYWALSRQVIRLGSMLSAGMRLGRAEGFNSGASLDYVYRNEARGLGVPGRLADRHYLDAIGWRGIRQRRRHLEQLLRDALARLRAEGREQRLLDVAAGHGRYVLDVVAGLVPPPESVELRDTDAGNLRAGNAHIAELGCGAYARFVAGDAYDFDTLARTAPRPTLAVVSGLYELCPENAPVRRSLAGLAAAVPAGGYLVYTAQPWHPQLELIARTLCGRDGEPWVMRRRTQLEMDQLVAEAGFDKLVQCIDPWGLFTVSLARRRGP